MDYEKGRELINSTDSNYNTPLHLAALKGNIEAIGVLLKSTKTNVKVDAKNEVNKTPTHLAASEGHTVYVCHFLYLMNSSLNRQ